MKYRELRTKLAQLEKDSALIEAELKSADRKSVAIIYDELKTRHDALVTEVIFMLDQSHSIDINIESGFNGPS